MVTACGRGLTPITRRQVSMAEVEVCSFQVEGSSSFFVHGCAKFIQPAIFGGDGLAAYPAALH